MAKINVELNKERGFIPKSTVHVFLSEVSSFSLIVFICLSLPTLFSHLGQECRSVWCWGGLSERKKNPEEGESRAPPENLESGVRCWVTHTDVASQICHFHVKPSQMDHGEGRGGWHSVKGGCKGEEREKSRGERESDREKGEQKWDLWKINRV